MAQNKNLAAAGKQSAPPEDRLNIGKNPKEGMIVLPREFYSRDPRVVARQLLGKVLVRSVGGKLLAGRLVELEAYLGVADPAAHAAAGQTPRNSILFGPPGHAYVYFIYGMYYCLNISCMPPGEAGCVLVRALEPLSGMEAMAALRGADPRLLERPQFRRLLTSGPGRLCQALDITRVRDNGKDVTSPVSDLQIVDDGYGRPRVVASPRVGIRKAIEAEWRFTIAGNTFVSGKRLGG